MPLQAPGPDVRLARTHGPPPAPPFSVVLCEILCETLCSKNTLAILCDSLWFFVSLAVEGLALWACTVIAAQREVCHQASKLPNFHLAFLRGMW